MSSVNHIQTRAGSDTLTQNGEAFSLDNVVEFQVINRGSTDCQIGYIDGPKFCRVEKGTQREFSGLSGYVYGGEMNIQFDGNAGDVEIFKRYITTNER